MYTHSISHTGTHPLTLSGMCWKHTPAHTSPSSYFPTQTAGSSQTSVPRLVRAPLALDTTVWPWVSVSSGSQSPGMGTWLGPGRPTAPAASTGQLPGPPCGDGWVGTWPWATLVSTPLSLGGVDPSHHPGHLQGPRGPLGEWWQPLHLSLSSMLVNLLKFTINSIKCILHEAQGISYATKITPTAL